MNSEEETKSGYYVYGVREPQIFEAYAEALAYAKKAGETAAREKALEQGAIEISDVIFQEEQYGSVSRLRSTCGSHRKDGFYFLI